MRSGQALAALIIPADIVQKLSTGGLEQPTLDVIYNAENPLKRQFVESTIQSQLAKANQALSGEFRKVAVAVHRPAAQGRQLQRARDELQRPRAAEREHDPQGGARLAAARLAPAGRRSTR